MKASYRLENFEKIKHWHVYGRTNSTDDDDDESPGRLGRVKAAYDDAASAKLSLACHVILFGEIPGLVKDLSAEFDHLKVDIIRRLQSLGSNLKANRSERGAERTFQEVVQKHCQLQPAQYNQMKSTFVRAISNAAQEGYASFIKHVEPTLGHYILRMRYNIAVEPEGSDDSDDSEYVKTFFGCSDEDFGNDIIVQWIEYRAMWRENTARDPKWYLNQSNYMFWQSQATRWPRLSYEAKWWNNFPTSSIAAERTFALARLTDTSQRGRLSWKSFSEQLQLRVNRPIVEKLLEDQVEKIKGMMI